MLQGTVRQIKITPKFILHQNAKFSTRQYFHLYGIYIDHSHTDEGMERQKKNMHVLYLTTIYLPVISSPNSQGRC